MIKKLDLLKMFNERQTEDQWNKAVETTVNLLVDAVNELQAQVAILEEHAHPTATTEPIKIPCKRKLKEITFEDDWYKEKEIEIEFIPDDDIIYKGE